MSCLMSAPTSLSTEKLHRRERSQLDADLRHLCPACLALVWTQEGGKSSFSVKFCSSCLSPKTDAKQAWLAQRFQQCKRMNLLVSLDSLM